MLKLVLKIVSFNFQLKSKLDQKEGIPLIDGALIKRDKASIELEIAPNGKMKTRTIIQYLTPISAIDGLLKRLHARTNQITFLLIQLW